MQVRWSAKPATVRFKKWKLLTNTVSFTMGWCINCHRETEIKGENGYYAGAIDGSASISDRLVDRFHEEKITVANIGGLECGKCHY
jgi:hypothetical protein